MREVEIYVALGKPRRGVWMLGTVVMHVERCSPLLIIGEMLVNLAVRYQLTPGRMTAVQKNKKQKNQVLVRVWKIRTPAHCW